jgi:hypothetical protein
VSKGRLCIFRGSYEKSTMEFGAKSRRQHRRGQRETEHRRNWSGAAGRCRRNGCRCRRLAGAVAGADHLFGSDPCSGGTADKSGSGCRAAGRALATADGAWTGFRDPAPVDAGLSVRTTPRSGDAVVVADRVDVAGAVGLPPFLGNPVRPIGTCHAMPTSSPDEAAACGNIRRKRKTSNRLRKMRQPPPAARLTEHR